MEHLKIDGGEVLCFVDEDSRKLRVCTTEQCGHIYLIVIVDEARVGGFDRAEEDFFEEEGADGADVFGKGSVELDFGNEPFRVWIFSFWYISERFCKVNGPVNFPKDFPRFTGFATG